MYIYIHRLENTAWRLKVYVTLSLIEKHFETKIKKVAATVTEMSAKCIWIQGDIRLDNHVSPNLSIEAIDSHEKNIE